MPTTPSRARVFLKKGKAQVINKTPFSIKLTFETTTYHQKISVGIDPGKIVGLAATSYKKTLFLQEVTTRSDISKNIKTRRDLRRGRRYRNTRYRKARFLNRGSSKAPCKNCGGNTKTGQKLCKACLKSSDKGHYDYAKILKTEFRLPPSIKSQQDATFQSIQKMPLPPPSKITIENAFIDIRALKGDSPEGSEYQTPLYKELHAKEACRNRDKNKCRMSGCKIKTNKKQEQLEKIEVHHIQRKSDGGTDTLENLVCLHKACHKALHDSPDYYKNKEVKQLKEYAKKETEKFTNSSVAVEGAEKNAQLPQQGKNYLCFLLKEEYGEEKIEKTFGFRTKFYRNKNRKETANNNWGKSHVVDALVIADSNSKDLPSQYIKTICVRSRKRQLHEQKPPKRRKRQEKLNISVSKKELPKWAYEKAEEIEPDEFKLTAPRRPKNRSYAKRKANAKLKIKEQIFPKHATVKVTGDHTNMGGTVKSGTICFIASFSNRGSSAHLKKALPDGSKSLAKSVSLNKLEYIYSNQGRLIEMDNIENTLQ